MNSDLNQPLKGRDKTNKSTSTFQPKHLLVALAVCLVGGGFIYQSLSTQSQFREIEVAIAEEPADKTPPISAQPTTPEIDTTIKEGVFAGAKPLEFDAPDEDGSRTLLPNGAAIIKVPQPTSRDISGQITITDPTKVPTNPRFAHLPDKDLLEQYGEFRLPRRGPSGNRPFEVYARTWSGVQGPRVALMVGGLGLSQTGTKTAIDRLPPQVTLGFAATGNSLSRWMQLARRGGHEIMLQMPMEPYNYPANNPGQGTLEINASADENLAKMRRSMGKMTNYTGIANFMGARMTADGRSLQPIMEELTTRGLMYLDDGSSPRSVAQQVANATSTPFARADKVIDNRRDRGAILKELNELERIARGRGYAIGTGSSFKVTIDAIDIWIQGARKRGIDIVPISALALDPESINR